MEKTGRADVSELLIQFAACGSREGIRTVALPSISEQFGFSQSKITSMLYRSRGKLKVQLVKEGYY